MTYEQTRDFIKEAYIILGRKNGKRYTLSHVSNCIDAIEKQIPKHTIQVNKCTYWKCSSCGSDVGDSTYRLNYCGVCGQKQDWSQVKYWN